MKEKRRRTIALILFVLVSLFVSFAQNIRSDIPASNKQTISTAPEGSVQAASALARLETKGRAPKTGYKRDKFLSDWSAVGNCDVRNLILQRDLTDIFIEPIDKCLVIRGRLDDPYTGKIVYFQRGEDTSSDVQIDHVVALSDAWQKGAQQLDDASRNLFANDPLNLLAVDGPANQKKGDGDAATWLPSNNAYRCRYIARQIAVKLKYHLWVTAAERDAMGRQLKICPDQVLPVETPKV